MISFVASRSAFPDCLLYVCTFRVPKFNCLVFQQIGEKFGERRDITLIFFQEFFQGGESIVIHISFVMLIILLFSEQISEGSL